MKIGSQKRIPATPPGMKQKGHIFGAYNLLKDTVSWTTAKTKNSAEFIRFLEELLVMCYPSVLNPIERFWRHLKDLACANKLQDNIDDVMAAVETALLQQNDPEATLRFHVSKNL